MDQTPRGTLQKVSAVLEALARSQEPASLQELSAVLPFPKPTLRRLLLQLVGAGMVIQDSQTRKYRLGRRLITLAAAVLDDIEVRRVGRDCLYELMRITQESVYLTVLDGQSIIYVDVVECERSVRVLTRVGMRRPASTTATGRTLLAFSSEDVRKRYLNDLLKSASTETHIDPLALSRELDAIRARGFAVSRDEAEVGVTGVAAPIFDKDDRCVAALGVAVPTYRFDEEKQRVVCKEVVRTARHLSELAQQGSDQPGTHQLTSRKRKGDVA
jgi:DNA-binding IclR family transcriptional regulator